MDRRQPAPRRPAPECSPRQVRGSVLYVRPVVGGVEHDVDGIEPYPVEAGRAAFGVPASLVLRVLRRGDFRFLREARDPSR